MLFTEKVGMKKLTLCIMSTFLWYPSISTCGKPSNRKKQIKISYGIIQGPEAGITIIHTANVTEEDEKNKILQVINDIAQLDKAIKQCEKNSEQISELTQKIKIIEKQHHLRRLPPE